MSADLVGVWDVALADGVHRIEFEHGTTTGKRIIRVDGKEIRRHDWMFKLVGKEQFMIGKVRCCVAIDAVAGFAYEYTLNVNGKSLKKFTENQSKITKCWTLVVDDVQTRVVLEKDTLDVWCSGQKLDTTGEFVEDGTETHFSIGSHVAYIKAVSSGKKREGIIHTLVVDGNEVPEARD
ncbi:PREDICTED: fas apoptotic inhibitory molecule 1-like [Priapulus caudatus]|uniref:Fas apoptotic inhibitory molecule 1-like n=1 Tax=Priapulus caudatus TaxID=37621 RepID=A0ABM1ERN4_PRICU|nr:PREDICTED: fas apoptotic inhibitory molecule 1-like [Priapulus caudatus]